MVAALVGIFLQSPGPSSFTRELGNNSLTTGGTRSSSDLPGGSEHIDFVPLSSLGEVAPLVGFFSNLGPGPLGHLSGSVPIDPSGRR